MPRSDAQAGFRRSFIMLAVLVCMMSAILLATGLLFISQTEAAGAAGSADAAQSRALLWSGAQAIMSRLADQRDHILAGELPEIDSQLTMYEADSRLGVVRLLPLSDGRLLSPESSRLDLNRIDAEALARTGVVDRLTADAIIAWRDGLGRPVQSITELLNAPEVTVEALYGSLDALLKIDAARGVARENRNPSSGAVRGLADVVTVFAVEPAVQFTGARRINLNVKWSDELGRRIEERFGAEAAALLKQVFESGTKFDSDASLVKSMRAYNTPLEQWPAILDAFTTESSEHHFGRLNINAAPREALLGLPGVTEEQATQIVNTRESLAPEIRGSAAWPVLNQILSAEAFEPLAELMTTRSWTFRVRIAAGEVDADEPDGPLRNPQLQEMVIDLAGARPRIAYLRDVTLLRDAALLAMQSTGAAEEEFTEAPERAAQPPTSRPAPRGRAPLPGRDDVAASQADRDDEEDRESTEAATQPDRPSRIGRWTGGES